MANIHWTPIMTSVHERQVETSVETSEITPSTVLLSFQVGLCDYGKNPNHDYFGQ